MGNGPRAPWSPGGRTMAVEFYLRMIMRYGVGGGGFAWELVVDKGKNPLVLLVAAMLATSTDVVGIVRGLIRQAKLEERTLDDLLAEEGRRKKGGTDEDRGVSPS